MVCTAERQRWGSWFGKEPTRVPSSRSVPTCPHGLWICPPCACIVGPTAQRDHKTIPDAVPWAGRTGEWNNSSSDQWNVPQKAELVLVLRSWGLIYGLCTPRGEENPSFPGSFCRGARAVPAGTSRAVLGSTASRAGPEPGDTAARPRSPPGCWLLLRAVGRGRGSLSPCGWGGSDEVAPGRLPRRQEPSLPSQGRALSPPPRGAMGWCLGVLLSHRDDKLWGQPKPFLCSSPWPPASLLRRVGCQQFICCLSSLSLWRSQDVFWVGEFGSVGFTSRSLRCSGTYLAFGVPCGTSHRARPSASSQLQASATGTARGARTAPGSGWGEGCKGQTELGCFQSPPVFFCIGLTILSGCVHRP